MRPKLLTGFEEDVYNGYLSYFTAYTNRNWDGMLKTFHPEITAVGTGIDEVKLSWEEIIEFYRREFEQAPEAMKYDITDVFVQKISSDSALLVLTCHMKYASLQQHFCVPNNRTTAIMKLSGGAWKLLHGHWSQPAEGQDIGESIPYKKLQEKNKNLEQIVLARTQQIQDQNEKLEKLNNTKNHLFSIIAHDLRSPFNV
ncbi:MAG: nuclear transport factor 2 family protein [Salinivirgaceae bacterium]|nr:nuclear transport factor 2 family protein [Salinivirgaceae bacterium]